MRIAYIATSTIPSQAANSIHVMKMCNALAKLDNQVFLIVPSMKKDMAVRARDVFKFYGVDRRFSVLRIPWVGFKGKSLIFGLIAALKAVFLKPDVVYARDLFGAFFAAMFGINVVLEAHSSLSSSSLFLRFIFTWLIRSCKLKKLVVITESLRKDFVNYFPILSGKIQVLPDGADQFFSTHTLSSDVISTRIQVGYIGHLYDGKGMEVIEKLAKKCEWADFHIVGGTDDDIKFWKDRCQGNKNLIFHGFVAPSQVSKFLSFFEIVLLPNQEKVFSHGTKRGEKHRGIDSIGQWTSPLKLFEYMSAGKAIISSDLPVLREILKNNFNAILCPPTDIEQWEKALIFLANDHEMTKFLGKNAKEEFLKNYSWESRAKKVLSSI